VGAGTRHWLDHSGVGRSRGSAGSCEQSLFPRSCTAAAAGARRAAGAKAIDISNRESRQRCIQGNLFEAWRRLLDSSATRAEFEAEMFEADLGYRQALSKLKQLMGKD